MEDWMECKRDEKTHFTAKTINLIAEYLLPKTASALLEEASHTIFGPGSRDLRPFSLESIREVWNCGWSIKRASQMASSWTSICALKYCHIETGKRFPKLLEAHYCLHWFPNCLFLVLGITRDDELKINMHFFV